MQPTHVPSACVRNSNANEILAGLHAGRAGVGFIHGTDGMYVCMVGIPLVCENGLSAIALSTMRRPIGAGGLECGTCETCRTS